VRAALAVVWIAVRAKLELRRDLVLECVAALRKLLVAELVFAGIRKVEESLIVEQESQKQKRQSN
jgi:hypothetical protein